MKEKMRKYIHKVSDILELLVAVIVVVGLLYNLGAYLLSEVGVIDGARDTQVFVTFLGNMFNFAVGIEFIKIMLKPSTENVIETLVFLIARHMIIGENTALDILASVVSVVLLFAIRWAIRWGKEKYREKEKCGAIRG